MEVRLFGPACEAKAASIPICRAYSVRTLSEIKACFTFQCLDFALLHQSFHRIIF